jgi:DNA-binding transcriptional regulator YiaG
MKELRNEFDRETSFTDLDKAKFYYTPSNMCDREDYLGDDWDAYVKKYNEYKTSIQDATSLEELAEVLNRYTDIFDNGTEYKVINHSNLKTHRTASGLSQSQLSAASDVNLQMIQKYEMGVKDINKAQAGTLLKLAKTLNCTIEDLLEEEHL